MTQEMSSRQRPAPEPALSPLKRAFLALENAQQRIASLEGASREPIAVIGIGCRVPGADNPDAFWRLMRDGVDAISAIPPDRFDINAFFDPDPETPGTIATRHGGFLRDVDQFDCGFFGIAPREAQGIDPQQRLLLEVSWEALEHAGQAPLRLENSKTGVYFGLCANDYSYLQILSGDRGLLNTHFTSGIAQSVAAGRLSYLLGLQGPSLAVDTACSSSLVAVHLACQALRNGDCRMALAGGVNLILAPELFIALSHSRMLAPDGRCKTFSAAADGFSRGEGCGVVVLKRLVEAKADGDRVLAVIRGTAINQDGPSSALTAPNGPAQEDVIRTTLARAGVKPREVGYVEAHGTGTQLGDPLEIQALSAVFRGDRDPATPLVVGSVKTNIGHLEAAAGVTGLIKLILALRHKEIPPHLHMTAPNPHIDWKATPLKVADGLMPWIPIDGRRIGGVSAFGFSGTNAHVVVEEALAETSPRSSTLHVQAGPTPHLFALSARDAPTFAVHARHYAATVRQYQDHDLADVCHTANFGRSHFAERATIIAHTIGELSERLGALERAEQAHGIRRARLARRDLPRVAFVFTGQGSQYSGMARGLNQCCPAFREAFDRCAALLAPYLSRPLHEVVFSDGVAQADLNNTGYTQPALFAVEYALAETWRSFGVKPSIVAGHSVGEIVAATVAGVLSLEDGIRLVARRSALMATLPAGGAMAAIAASEQDVAAIVGLAIDVSIAAVNAPTQTVISGPIAEVDAVCASLAGRGVRHQRLAVSHAFHSSLMDPILEAFEREIQTISFAPPRLQLVSNLTGGMAGADELTQPRYWRRHLREAVRFGDCVRTIERQKPDCVVEIGPQPTLLSLFGAASTDGPALVPSLRKGCHDWEQMLRGVSALFLAGAEIDWRGAGRGERREIVDLPTYPFRRQRHWFEAKPRPVTTLAVDSGHHPLLGRPLPSPLPQKQFESRLSGSAPAFIDEHRIGGTALLPGAAGVELAVAAATAVFGPGAHAVEDLEFREAMIFTDGARVVHTIVDPIQNGTSRFQIQSRSDHTDEWTLHFEGRLRPAASAASPKHTAPLSEIAERCSDAAPIDDFYELFRERGVAFGPRFHVVRELRRGNGEALSSIALGEESAHERRYSIHPILLDGCLQTVMAALHPDGESSSLYLPVGLRRFRSFDSLGLVGCAHAVLDAATPPDGPILRANVNLYGPGDDLVAAFEGIEFQRVGKDALIYPKRGHVDTWLYERVWKPAPPLSASQRRPSSWVVLEDRGGIGTGLVEALVKRGDRCVRPSIAGDGHGVDTTAAHAAWRKWRDECGEISGVVDLRWLDCGSGALSRSPDLALRTSVSQSLALFNAAIVESGGRPIRLWVVTRGAQPAGDVKSPLSPAASAAWGLAWSAALEHPELRAVCIDLDNASNADETSKLIAELDEDGREDKVALRGDRRLVARLRRRDRTVVGASGAWREPYRLESTGQGTTEGLVLAPAERRMPGRGEVEIRVHATGLNFRDVLSLLGLYPGDAGPLGGECAGEVARVGEGVQGIREGDRVVAMTSGCFASHVIARQQLVQQTPVGFSAKEAAVLPIAYLTAGFALEETARLTDRDRVLIHAAAGGVGLAAVHLALRIGAEIFATAGSEAKRAYLRAIGVHHVLDSRDDAFDAEVLRLTNGNGVDVVLNSLSGSFIAASFRATGLRGRFIELGKRGIWDHDQVTALGRDIDYHIVDLGDASAREPERIAKLFSRLMDDLAGGALPALPVTPFALDEVSGAFRHMMTARHIGKIVVSHQRAPPAPLVRPDGQYLVTGGLSGLGLEVAEWLVARGARHISLVGRRGGNSPDALGITRRMTAAGATVTVAAVDVGDKDALGAFLAERRMAGPPLRGIVHAAGVIDDAVFASQDWSRFERVLRPKFGGARNLDRLTRADVLDWFVMFSSAASLLGSPGQANYAAANTMLDVIAQERRRLGRPGLSVNWGPWGQVGLAASQTMKERLAASGLMPLTAHEALAALETAMRADTAQVGIVAADWTRLLERRDKNSPPSPYFSEVVSTKARTETLAAEQKSVAAFRDTLQRAAPGRRHTLMRNFVRETSFRVLGLIEANGPADNTPLSEVGLDSLLAIELRSVLGKSLEVALPATLLFDHPTIEALSGFLLREMCEIQAPSKKQNISDRPTDRVVERPEMLAEIAELSDAEVEILIGLRRQ
jgi:acyl transferase domain-containing protein/NAD(P)-dependent dehydrogenase (short-subunit alcohol dehydrogenase family)